MEQKIFVEEFGKKQFNETVIKSLLPQAIFKKWQQAVRNETQIDRETADALAHAMKVWAIELGATHYCHWFQPMTGLTAEKHDAFFQPDSEGRPITRLAGKSLLKGEADGSSFPNGGLRTTFEARGYTYLDITSYAFVRGHVLFIPCVFISYTGAKLDQKMPLLAALESFSTSASEVLQKIGYPSVKSVKAMIGLEQEYFLVDRTQAAKRPDIVFTGKTLFGAPMPKGQGLNDHYFGALSERVSAFMKEVNQKCWEMGIYAFTEHNEVAPGQYEFVSIYNHANLAVDQNMVVMDTLKRMALRHELMCLLNEKPFDGVNGSGKHNNFSLLTDTGINLFEIGNTDLEHLKFTLFVSAFIQTVDRYATLIRMTCSDEGNDYRLGGHEAPPAIVSIFLGDDLHHLFEKLALAPSLTLGDFTKAYSPITNLPALPLDIADRNRTSPISFTGNKFEIRMLGSSRSASALNTVLLAGIADSLMDINHKLEGIKPAQIKEKALQICHEIIKAHQRVLFNGDGYSLAWKGEAAKRGLANLPNYIDSVETLKDPQVRAMLSRTKVLNEAEIDARYDIYLNQFNQVVLTQADTLIGMVNNGIIPALANTIRLYTFANEPQLKFKAFTRLIEECHTIVEQLDVHNQTLIAVAESLHSNTDKKAVAEIIKLQVRPLLSAIKEQCNRAERIIPKELFPYPTLQELIV